MTMSILCCITVNGLFCRVHAMKLTARRMRMFFFSLSKRWKSNPVLVSCFVLCPRWKLKVTNEKKKKKKHFDECGIYASYLFMSNFEKKKTLEALFHDDDDDGDDEKGKRRCCCAQNWWFWNFDLFCFVFPFANELVKAQKNCVVISWTTTFFALGILTTSRINALNSRRNDQHILLVLLQLPL